MKIIETQTKSHRGTMIPLTVVEADRYPARLLLCVHGFKANRTEDGRFLQVAQALAEDGIASVMMGFPGCDVSKEDFISYTLNSCLADIDAARSYMEERYELQDEIGMIGYSMGGRLTALYVADHPEVRCIGLWAAATYEGFGGSDEFLGIPLVQMKQEAAEKGWCDFHNLFDDTHIRLNRDLIAQMEELSVNRGLQGYEGCAIVVHGDQDITVPYATAVHTCEALQNAKETKLVTVAGADHGFGAWDDHPELSKQLTDATIAFFRSHFA